MKILCFHCVMGVVVLFSSTSDLQSQEVKLAKSVVMRQGIFWPKYQTEGRVFWNGRWQDPAFNINSPEEIASALEIIPSLRGTDEYNLHVLSLLLAAQNPSTHPNIAIVLGNELGWHIDSGDMSTASSINWKGANLSGYLNLGNLPSFGGTKAISIDFSALGLSGSTMTSPSARNVNFSGSSFANMDLSGLAHSNVNQGLVIFTVVQPTTLGSSMQYSNVDFSNATNLNVAILGSQRNPQNVNLNGTGIDVDSLKSARHNYLMSHPQANNYKSGTVEFREQYLNAWVGGFTLN